MNGLLVDFGGVLTTNVFDSFRAFSEANGLDPQAVKTLFRENPEALGLLRQLERGELEEDEFSAKFAPLLGIESAEGLVSGLFAGIGPDEAMIEAVAAARAAGIRTGLISNSWGRPDMYDPAMLDRAVRRGGHLGRGRDAQAERRHLPARRGARRASSRLRPSSWTTCARTAPAPRRWA